MIRTQGCGKIALGGPGGYGGASQTFDAESGALIGVYEYSDIASGPCEAFGYISGDALFVGIDLNVRTELPGGGLLHGLRHRRVFRVRAP